MSFLRHGEIYPPMRARPLPTAPPTHRLDEFPAGYSLAGCSPAEPASASPADAHSEVQSYRRSSVFHRTATSVLTGCLTPGGRLNIAMKPVIAYRKNALFGVSSRQMPKTNHPPTPNLKS